MIQKWRPCVLLRPLGERRGRKKAGFGFECRTLIASVHTSLDVATKSANSCWLRSREPHVHTLLPTSLAFRRQTRMLSACTLKAKRPRGILPAIFGTGGGRNGWHHEGEGDENC